MLVHLVFLTNSVCVGSSDHGSEVLTPAGSIRFLPNGGLSDSDIRDCTRDDEEISPLHTMQGPITRARVRQLDLQIRSKLINCFSKLILGFMHVLLIRNNGEN
jgi:hypothetical protein